MTAHDISLADAMIQRRSVRGFTDKPVPKEVLDAVFSLAQRSPSNCNIQPWKVWVASGAVRDALRERMVEKVTQGVPFAPDYASLPRFEGVYRERQVDCAMALYGSMGIAREDRPGRQRAELRNFELFDAPHVAFIGMERDFGVTVGPGCGHVCTVIAAVHECLWVGRLCPGQHALLSRRCAGNAGNSVQHGHRVGDQLWVRGPGCRGEQGPRGSGACLRFSAVLR